MLSHEHKRVKINVIRVLSHLQILESKEILIENFDMYDLEIQKEIILLIEELYESKDDSFLIKQVAHESFEIKFTTLKMLSIYNKAKFKSMETSLSDLDFVRIVEHLKAV